MDRGGIRGHVEGFQEGGPRPPVIRHLDEDKTVVVIAPGIIGVQGLGVAGNRERVLETVRVEQQAGFFHEKRE